MKFKGQGKINICGFEYKKNIAGSRRGGGGGGGVPSTQKKPVSAPAYRPAYGYVVGLRPNHITMYRHGVEPCRILERMGGG